MKKLLVLLVITLFFVAAQAQRVGINNDGSLPDNSAMLDVKNPNKGLLIPRVALTGTGDVSTIPSPTTSLLVYNTTAAGSGGTAVAPGYYYWNGTAWVMLSTITTSLQNGTAWLVTGNAGTDTSLNFLGTTDSKPLQVKLNNVRSGYIGTGTDGNVFWGYQSGSKIGYSNVGIGIGALQFNQAPNTVGIGDSALYNNNSSFAAGYNVGVGSKALYSNTSGGSNVAIGWQALKSNTTAYDNSAVGWAALTADNTGHDNTAMGNAALITNTTGNNNTATGSGALQSNTTGGGNTANGVNALFKNTTGVGNTANGYKAFQLNTTGSNNTANGIFALYNNTTGFSNVAVGIGALDYNTTSYNLVAVGDSALYNNTALGNTAVGSKTLFSNTTGGGNTANGYQSLFNNQSGNSNTANGVQALYSNQTSDANTANGFQTLYSNLSGFGNTANGIQALFNNQTGNYNLASGGRSLYNNTTGFSNVAIGLYALQTNTTGTNNTAIGDSADVATNILTNATAIGNKAIVNASNTVQIGNSSVSDVYFGNGTTTVLHGTVNLPGISFADFYALMPPDNAATVPVGGSVQFPQNGPMNGIITRSGPSTFNLPAIGTYEINFQVSIIEAGQLVVVMNGSELPYTVVGRSAATTQIVGTCLITTTTINSIISINNPAGNSIALTIAALAGGSQPVSAHIVIKKLN